MLQRKSDSMHYLVTGGCGFIGSHLADALIARGHRVTILDDLSTGKWENAPAEASVIVGDATDIRVVEHAFDNIDGCFHLAAIASVEKSNIEWAKTHTVNLTATINIFQTASRGAKKIPVVYTSSAAVYGDCRTVPIAENAVTQPLTAYGADKLGCDLHARVASEVHGVSTIGLRPFNVYGPRQDPASPYSGVISIFADRMQRGLPVTIYGDGEQVRDFVYVGDAVRAFMAAMNTLHDQGKAGHDVFNLCTGHPTTINQLAQTIASVTGYQQEPNHAPARKGDIRVSIGNPARLSERLGLRLEVTLQEGLRAMVGYVQQGRDVPFAHALS
jgi:UDP-glucose 4-epimerase